MNLKFFLLVETPGGADEAEVSLVDKIGKRQPLVLVVARDRHHEPEVRLHQFFEGLPVALADAHRGLRLFLHRKRLVLADLLEIQGKRIFFREKLVLIHTRHGYAFVGIL